MFRIIFQLNISPCAESDCQWIAILMSFKIPCWNMFCNCFPLFISLFDSQNNVTFKFSWHRRSLPEILLYMI